MAVSRHPHAWRFGTRYERIWTKSEGPRKIRGEVRRCPKKSGANFTRRSVQIRADSLPAYSSDWLGQSWGPNVRLVLPFWPRGSLVDQGAGGGREPSRLRAASSYGGLWVYKLRPLGWHYLQPLRDNRGRAWWTCPAKKYPPVHFLSFVRIG